MITEGQVWVAGQPVRKPAEPVTGDAVIEANGDRYVSRAAHKLLGVLDDLGITVTGRALDAGSSTGGFTQVLLERGATEVVAVDVGTDQLHPLLRHDPRVRVWEQTNLRDLTVAHVQERPVDLTVADVSFISLTMLLEPLDRVTAESGSMLLMVKPQFEVGRSLLGKGGVVRSPELQRQAVGAVLDRAAALGWRPRAAAPSRLPGPAGNREFFVWLRRDATPQPPDLDTLVRPLGPGSAPSGGATGGAGRAPGFDDPGPYAGPGD